ncbi:YraN family protein [Fimbriimonadia bacterium ATM]|nr:MAG: YraN family protein [Armatimonadota bacterium]MBC6968589.1 YraN family protein [Armatimonadota bacterium]MCE7898572.1 YraN family protein [Armatimonadetes bacterium ATM1]MDL1928135.1 YraN family protein [Fimbriimonadia bacterium ATM]RIJ98300.1 MAG: YraN family protein [Armatimonadota bacterium]
MSRPRRLGSDIERRVADYLSRSGLSIVGRNFKRQGGELDIVALEDDTLVFVEVKYRRADSLVSPEESISAKKQEAIVKTAEQFLAENPEFVDFPVRFDVIAVEGTAIRHHRDAFRPGWP